MCPMMLNVPGLIHHNLKQRPYAIFWSPRPRGIHLTFHISSSFPRGQHRGGCFSSLPYNCSCWMRRIRLNSHLSYFLLPVKSRASLPAFSSCSPFIGSAGSLAPRFIWRALVALLNVSSRRERPSPAPGRLSSSSLADRYDIICTTCGSLRWWPNSIDTYPEACFCTDGKCPNSSKHTRYFLPPSHSSSHPGSHGHQSAKLCPVSLGISSESTVDVQPHRYVTTIARPCPIHS